MLAIANKVNKRCKRTEQDRKPEYQQHLIIYIYLLVAGENMDHCDDSRFPRSFSVRFALGWYP